MCLPLLPWADRQVGSRALSCEFCWFEGSDCFGNHSDVLLAFSSPQQWQVQASFVLQILSFFSLLVSRKEGDQKDGWCDKIESDFLTV